MANVDVSVSRVIPATASTVYDIVADYRNGHPRILPSEYFGNLDVLSGGRGEGTRIRFEMKAFGKVNIGTADITEPVPGRELRETLSDGIVTTFFVEPAGAGESRVTIRTTYSKPGLRGWFESVIAPRYLRRVYEAELEQLANVCGAR